MSDYANWTIIEDSPDGSLLIQSPIGARRRIWNGGDDSDPQCFQAFQECSQQKRWELYKAARDEAERLRGENDRLRAAWQTVADALIANGYFGDVGCHPAVAERWAHWIGSNMQSLRAENDRLRAENDRLRAENEHIRRELKEALLEFFEGVEAVKQADMNLQENGSIE